MKPETLWYGRLHTVFEPRSIHPHRFQTLAPSSIKPWQHAFIDDKKFIDDKTSLISSLNVETYRLQKCRCATSYTDLSNLQILSFKLWLFRSFSPYKKKFSVEIKTENTKKASELY